MHVFPGDYYLPQVMSLERDVAFAMYTREAKALAGDV
jgi:hypothetical protein